MIEPSSEGDDVAASTTRQVPTIGPMWRTRIAALAEVLAVLALANIVSVLANRALGISSFREEIAAVPEGALPNYYNLALISVGQLLFKWGIMFGLSYLIGRWHRNRRLGEYGVSKGNGSLGSYVALGIVAGLIVGFLSDFLVQADIYMKGSTDLVASAEAGRGTLGSWVLAAASAFVLPPILEELWMRGYAQTRLAEDYGVGTAIWFTAFIFGLSHTHFIQPDLFNIGTLISIVISGVVLGYLFYITGSLIPPILAHAVINLFATGPEMPIVLGGTILLAVVLWRAIFRHARDLGSILTQVGSQEWTIGGLIVIALLTIAVAIIPYSLLLWVIVGPLLFIPYEYRDRRWRMAAYQ
jgi:membrane protease YdiL (CAAX protease family)